MKQNKVLEIIIFCIFIILAIITSVFHEPWFDEIQAWAISKDTIYNILFVIPHYECHPPLWHLILKCFSACGVSPDIGIKVPNLIFMISAVWLLIFKSPFPKVIKLTLPFTYFILYQYTALSRPYSIFCFAIFLAACLYKTRNEHPYKYIFSLALLSFSCMYGMVFATGIVIAWAIQILTEEKTSFLKNILKDNRFKAAVILFFICLVNTMIIFRSPDALIEASGLNIIKILYVLFCLIGDSLITSVVNVNINGINHINMLYCLLGIVIYGILFRFLKNFKGIILFIVPYIMFLSVSLFYIAVQHIGLLTLFLIFVFWSKLSVYPMEINFKNQKNFLIIFLIVIAVQIFWGISAFSWDLKTNYWCSKTLPAVIKEKNLDKYYIMDFWLTNDMNNQPLATVVTAYIGKNIFYNFNLLYPEKEYLIYKKITDNEKDKIKEALDKKGIPEIYMGNPDKLMTVFDKEQFGQRTYELLTVVKSYPVYKTYKSEITVPVYVRDDLYDEIVQNKS